MNKLTYKELHLAIMGIWPGVGVALALKSDFYLVGVCLIAGIQAYVVDLHQRRSGSDHLEYFRQDAWYFTGSAVIAAVLTWVML
jgi:hypothetical protein